MAKFQNSDETPSDFQRRYAWKIGAARTVAIGFVLGSAALFAYGVFVLWVAL